MISDFGLAQWVNDVGVADVDAFYGKHLVPEAATSGSATIQADIFQVGMTLYRMCNGETDFQNQFRGINFQNQQERDRLIQRIQREEFPQREFLPHIPYKLKEIVKKCLKANPDQRYKSILELINDLGEVEDSLDWQFGFLNNNECWIKEENGYITSVLIQPENNNFSVRVTKKNIQTNRIINDNQNSTTGLRDLKAARNKIFSLFKNKL